MVLIRKDTAGNDTFGHSWPSDGAVVDVPAEQAAVLKAIPDGGFTEVDAVPQETQPPADQPSDEKESAEKESAEKETEADQPAAEAEQEAAESPARRRGRPPKK